MRGLFRVTVREALLPPMPPLGIVVCANITNAQHPLALKLATLVTQDVRVLDLCASRRARKKLVTSKTLKCGRSQLTMSLVMLFVLATSVSNVESGQPTFGAGLRRIRLQWRMIIFGDTLGGLMELVLKMAYDLRDLGNYEVDCTIG